MVENFKSVFDTPTICSYLH